MSQSTDQDLMAIAELLSPNIDASTVETAAPVPEPVPVEELEPVPDMYFDEVAATTSARDSMSSSVSSIYSSYHRPSSGSMRSSTYTDSDGASYMGDDLPDPLLLAPLNQQHYNGGFHLARGSMPMPALDDNRSLSSATSYSSLRTPSLSRHSSMQYFSSPPTSPTSSYLSSPVDGPAPPQQLNSKALGVIEESHYAEDYELRRVPSDDAPTIHMPTPSGPSFPAPEEQPYLMRRPEPRHMHSLPLQRRLPSLEKLRISMQTPESSYGQTQHQNQSYGQSQNQGYGQSQNQSYGQTQSQGYGQSQSSSYGHGQSPSQSSSQSQSYNQSPGQSQSRQLPSRTGFAHPPPPAPAPLYTPPAAPLSPVLSAKSGSSGGSSSAKGSGKSSGFGKLFGRGGDKESRKSTASSGSLHKSDQSVASFELGDAKADAKRLKKEAARARTERLAQDLADKARKRAEAVKAQKEELRAKKPVRTWEEEGDMYGGISYF